MKTLSNGFNRAIAATVTANGETLVYRSTANTHQDDGDVTRNFPDHVRAVTYNTEKQTAEQALGVTGNVRRVRWEEFSKRMTHV